MVLEHCSDLDSVQKNMILLFRTLRSHKCRSEITVVCKFMLLSACQ